MNKSGLYHEVANVERFLRVLDQGRPKAQTLMRLLAYEQKWEWLYILETEFSDDRNAALELVLGEVSASWAYSHTALLSNLMSCWAVWNQTSVLEKSGRVFHNCNLRGVYLSGLLDGDNFYGVDFSNAELPKLRGEKRSLDIDGVTFIACTFSAPLAHLIKNAATKDAEGCTNAGCQHTDCVSRRIKNEIGDDDHCVTIRNSAFVACKFEDSAGVCHATYFVGDPPSAVCCLIKGYDNA